MTEEKIVMGETEYQFEIDGDKWSLEVAKSQTYVKDFRQLQLFMEPSTVFVPATVKEDDSTYTFMYVVDKKYKKWKDVKELERNEKLRLLRNIARFKMYLHKRVTFFMHPDNIVFDDNFIPYIVHRGIRDIVPPKPLSDEQFLTQYKCLIVALFSKKYTYDDLYGGLLESQQETAFEQNVASINDYDELIQLLNKSFEKEQTTAEKSMQLVPKKRFKLFKYLSYSFIAATVVLLMPLIYLLFMKVPYQNTLLAANTSFIADNYDEVIQHLQDEEVESLPTTAKYELAYSYIRVERLADKQKETIMKNVSLKSDEKYLMYWIYNGKGDFDKSLDLGRQLGDAQLIMYGLIQKIEALKNDKELSGKERDDQLKKYEQQLKDYEKEYSEIMKDEKLEDTSSEEMNQNAGQTTEGEGGAANTEQTTPTQGDATPSTEQTTPAEATTSAE
ncbi:Type VII secretion protein EssB [Bacillus manliponensis]